MVKTERNKPSLFFAKNCQNTDLKHQNIVRGTPKKPDKTPKNGQNRFWVKILEPKKTIFRSFFYLPVIFTPSSGGPLWVKKWQEKQKIALIYWTTYIWKIRIYKGCLLKYDWDLLKIDFKNAYFQVFQGFPALKGTLPNCQIAQRWKLSKKRLEHFSRAYKP